MKVFHHLSLIVVFAACLTNGRPPRNDIKPTASRPKEPQEGVGAHNDPMADQFIDDEPPHAIAPGTPEDSVWAVQLSGKDLVIMALCVINLVVLAVLCCSCSRFGGASDRKYAAVEVVGDSEMEHFQP